MVKLNYSRNTIGCNVGGKIFIHPELYEYPELYHAVVAHEKKHTKSISKKDIALDLFNDDLRGCKGSFYRFLLTHPRTMLGYLPLSKVGKYWCFDIQLLVAWIFAIIVISYVGVNL